MLWEEWKHLDLQIAELQRQIETIAQQDDDCQRLQEIPGIGPLAATLIVASIGNGAAFRRGRDFAAWLGIVPAQATTGGKPRLLGISKRGNKYLRQLMVHGPRSVKTHMNRETHPMGEWVTALEKRSHSNVVSVAMANKIARIAWAVLATGEHYRPVCRPRKQLRIEPQWKSSFCWSAAWRIVQNPSRVRFAAQQTRALD